MPKNTMRASLLATLTMLFSLAAFAADMPKVMIESPQNGATVQDTAGLGPVAIIKFKTDNFKIESLGKHSDMAMNDMDKMAKMGHVHVTLDNADWYWVHSSMDPIVLVGLKPGQHSVKLELVGADHKPAGASQTVTFTMGGSGAMSGDAR